MTRAQQLRLIESLINEGAIERDVLLEWARKEQIKDQVSRNVKRNVKPTGSPQSNDVDPCSRGSYGRSNPCG